MTIFDFLPPFISFIIGTLVAGIELITSKYPRTFFLLNKSWALYAYTIIYGILSFGVMLAISSLVGAKIIKLEGLGISNMWVQAVVVGVATKAFLHIRVFNVSIGSQSFPVGIETFVYMFEPWLLRTIELDEFNAIRKFIDIAQSRYSALNDVIQKIKNNIPQKLSKVEKSAFPSDLSEKTTVSEAMELYLQYFGKKSFERIFPLP